MFLHQQKWRFQLRQRDLTQSLTHKTGKHFTNKNISRWPTPVEVLLIGSSKIGIPSGTRYHGWKNTQFHVRISGVTGCKINLVDVKYIHTYVHIYVYIYIYIYVYIYVYMYIYIYIYVQYTYRLNRWFSFASFPLSGRIPFLRPHELAGTTNEVVRSYELARIYPD